MAQFGSLLIEHRERLGLSSSRVAELVGRAPGTVRSWEKGRSTPDDAVVVTSLAAVLGIDEAELFRAAGLEPPGEPEPFSLESTLASIAPGSHETRPVAVPDPPAVAGRHAESTEERILDGRQSALDKLRSAVDSVSDSMTEGRKRRKRAPRPRSTSPVVVPAQPVHAAPVRVGGRRRSMRSLSYMEDVEQRWSYRMRAVLTGAGVAALLVVLGWAASGLLAAVGDLWDALTAGL